MSGGSFGYIEHIEFYPPGHLAEMADRLDQLAPGSVAARDTRALLAIYAALDKVANPDLRKVWHAVEWADSCDWPQSAALEAIAAFEEAP